MRFTLTVRADQLAEARSFCFSMPEIEGACFLLCSQAETEDEVRFLVREVVPVSDDAYLERRPDLLSLDSPSYVSVAKRARDARLSVVFVHSHPGGMLAYSRQDDREEPKLQEFLRARVPGLRHGSLVLTEEGIIGRVWSDGFVALERVRVVGPRFDFHFEDEKKPTFSEAFDRQVRAFGSDTQFMLSRLHVGIVGAGGTGSACIEELARLGVGTLSVFDGDSLETSNVNRVFGSSVRDEGRAKVHIAQDNVERIGLGTTVKAYSDHIDMKEVALHLRECDVVLGCTDKEAPRAVLTQLAIRYLIPLIDMGVLINSEGGRLREVVGRLTTFFPGEACLFCRGRITPEMIAAEQMSVEERAVRIQEGYAPELTTRSPAVIPFTSTVAALAVSELLHRLTGFMGNDRLSTETLIFFDKARITSNRQEPKPECICSQTRLWGKGDEPRFLGLWG